VLYWVNGVTAWLKYFQLDKPLKIEHVAEELSAPTRQVQLTEEDPTSDFLMIGFAVGLFAFFLHSFLSLPILFMLVRMLTSPVFPEELSGNVMLWHNSADANCTVWIHSGQQKQ
jgi:hypothetical protein